MLIKRIELKKSYPNDFSLKRPLDLETQLYQLLDALCMLIKPISLKKNLSQRFFPKTSARLGNAALSTPRLPMYVNKARFYLRKTYPNDFPIIRPLDLETQLYQLLEALCMLIKRISLKKNLS